MALPVIPSVQQIKDRIVSDVETKINQTIPALPLALVKVMAAALAATFFLSYQAIIWVYKQIFPSSADRASLILLGAVVGITEVAAVQAVLLCDVFGSGAQVDAGTLFLSNIDVTYRVTTTTAIVGGVAPNVPMIALTAGEIGNLTNGEVLDIVQPTVGLDGTATVTDTQTEGADIESDEFFAARVSLRYRIQYITGSTGAYAINGFEAPNFILILPYEDETEPGKVNVYGKVDNQPDGIPTAGQLTSLESYLEFDPDTGKSIRKPIGSEDTVLAIETRLFDIQVNINLSTAEINAAVEAAVIAQAATVAPFIEGLSDIRRNVYTQTDVAGAANSAAEGEGAQVISVDLTDVTIATVVDSYTVFGGTFIKVGTVSFVVVP